MRERGADAPHFLKGEDMNWGELKNEVRDLGFEENESLEEYRDILLSAANRAMGMINATIPLTARYDFTQDGTESGLKRYDMAELTKEDGRRTFLSFTDTLVRIGMDGTYGSFNDFEIEMGRVLIMDGTEAGDFSVFYKKTPAMVTSATTDDTLLDIDPRMDPALPLLTAHFVWLDDDERKATQYYNLYDQFKSEILAEMEDKKIRARIIGGI